MEGRSDPTQSDPRVLFVLLNIINAAIRQFEEITFLFKNVFPLRVPACTMSQNKVLKVAKSAAEDEAKVLQHGEMVSQNTMMFVDKLVNHAGLLVRTLWYLTSFDTGRLCLSSGLIVRIRHCM